MDAIIPTITRTTPIANPAVSHLATFPAVSWLILFAWLAATQMKAKIHTKTKSTPAKKIHIDFSLNNREY